jgi:hypothetical protein
MHWLVRQIILAGWSIACLRVVLYHKRKSDEPLSWSRAQHPFRPDIEWQRDLGDGRVEYLVRNGDRLHAVRTLGEEPK